VFERFDRRCLDAVPTAAQRALARGAQAVTCEDVLVGLSEVDDELAAALPGTWTSARTEHMDGQVPMAAPLLAAFQAASEDPGRILPLVGFCARFSRLMLSYAAPSRLKEQSDT
jgi:hypothetical protein